MNRGMAQEPEDMIGWGDTGTGRPGRARYFLIGMLLAMVMGLLLCCVGAVAWQQRYEGRVIPGVWVAGINLQGKMAPEVEAELRRAWSEVGPRHLALRDGDRQYVLTLEELGISWDLPATVKAVMEIGHTGSLLQDGWVRLRGMQQGVAVPAVWMFDEGKASLALRRQATEIDVPPRSANFDLSGAAPRSDPGVQGRELDVDATLERLRQVLRTGLPQTLDVAVRTLPPTVIDGEAARQQAEQLLARQVMVTYEEDGVRRSWALGRDVIAQSLQARQETGENGQVRWTVSLQPEALAGWVATIAQEIDRPLIEGRVRLDSDRRASITVPSQSGRQVNTEEAFNRVLAALESGNASVELPVEITRPYVTPEEVTRWGQLNLLSEGVSTFKGSDPGRKQNIVNGASFFQGLVVPPGATFSFGEHLGPITLAEGWAEAYVIIGDRTELGAGGGICQVATTVFRAAFFGGFPIVQRYPHAYRVGWYEPPLGLDATVYTPYVDLQFKNDLEFPIIIQDNPDTTNGVLTFRFYGPDELGRTVEMEGPVTDMPEKAPPPIYEDDPSLAPGQVKQVDTAHDGLRATIYRIIKRGDEVIARETFVSLYKAWPARYKRGPEPAKP